MNGAATLFDADAAAFTGTVEVLGVIFSAEDDGYAVLEVQDAESGEGFALVGPVAHLSAGDRAEVSGDWQTHSRYGRQLKARGALPLDPADRAGQIAYLTTLRHIGPARAERLVDEHGEGVLGAIAADPDGVFGSLRGVSATQAAAAAESWHASRAIRDLHVQLAPHGLAHLAAPIHARFGERSMSVLHEDPYRLTEVAGVGFARADKIALAADVPPESERRAQAAAVFALSEAEQQGNTYLPLEELNRRTAKLIGLRPDPDVAGAGAGAAARRGPRLPRADPRQRGRRRRDAGRPRRGAVPTSTTTRATRRPRRARPRRQLTDEQWAAVRGAFAARISVLTGGPGVGKTACTQAIVAEAERADVAIALCAPTGRAARRLEEATGHEAQTIHRMLEWMPGREPAFRPGHPLPADLVDRRRVLDAEPAADRGAARRARRVDPRRLRRRRRPAAADRRRQAVRGPDRLRHRAGRPAHPDLPPGGALDDHHRRPRDQPGPAAATCEPAADQDHDFFFIDRPSPERALETVVEVVAERAPASFGVDPIREVQVLAPMYKGAVGIDALNERLQARLNPDGRAAVSERFRIGDRLIQTRNSHELGLMNGSIVFLRADDPERGVDRRRHRRGRLADHPLRRDGDAAPRLRDLGPQGAGLRGAGRGRRLPPLPRPDADPPAALHGDHPRPPQLRPGRRPRRAGDGGPPRRQRRPPLGPRRAPARLSCRVCPDELRSSSPP